MRAWKWLARLDRLSRPNGVPRLSDERMTRWCAGGYSFVPASCGRENPPLKLSTVCSYRRGPASSYAVVRSISLIPKAVVPRRRFRQAGPETTNDVDSAISLSALAILFSLSAASALRYASRMTQLTSNEAETST